MSRIPLTQKAVIKLQKMLFQKERETISIRKEFVETCKKIEYFATVNEELNKTIQCALSRYKLTEHEMEMWLLDNEDELSKWADLRFKYIEHLNEEYKKNYKEDHTDIDDNKN